MKSVIAKPVFEKIAGIKVSKNSAEWKEAIIKSFIETVGEKLPQNVSYDAVVDNNDENQGFAAGSIVVWNGSKKINFPVIIRDYELCPFDTFIIRSNGKTVYSHANKDSIAKALMTQELFGEYKKEDLSNKFIKLPGGMPMANAVMVEKLASELTPEVLSNFAVNSGSAINTFVNSNLSLYETQKAPVVMANQMSTMFESEILDPNELTPIPIGFPGEVRIKTYPTLEDFSGDPTNGVIAKKIGKASIGLSVVAKRLPSDRGRDYNEVQYSFISVDGFYSGMMWDGEGMPFGTTMSKEVIPTIMEALKKYEITSYGYNQDSSYKRSRDGYSSSEYQCDRDDDIVIVTSSGEIYKNHMHKLKTIHSGNDRIFILNESIAFIPADTESIIRIEGVKDATLKSLIGNMNNTYVYPRNSLFLKMYQKNDFITPSTDIMRDLINLERIKVEVSIGESGLSIKGYSAKEINNLMGGVYTVESMKNAIKMLGFSEANYKKIASELISKGSCTVYGACPPDFSKVASEFNNVDEIDEALGTLAKFVERNLIKEASEIQDPRSVEAVLSLNTVNKDTVLNVVENIDLYKETADKIAEMLVMSRMGMTTVNEDALKRVMENLTDVINGVEKVKSIIG